MPLNRDEEASVWILVSYSRHSRTCPVTALPDDLVPPLNKRPCVTAPPSSLPGASTNVAHHTDRAIRRRSFSDHYAPECRSRYSDTTTRRSSKSKIVNIPPSVMPRQSQKQKRVISGSDSSALDSEDLSGSVDMATLAAMYSSRYSIRWRSSASTAQSTVGLALTPVEIDSTSLTPAIRSTSAVPGTCTSSTTPD